MKHKIIYIVIILTIISCKQQPTYTDSKTRIELDDVQLLIGEWTGKLTYLDYTTNNPFSMPADLVIEESKNPNQYILKNIYPNEPSANNSDKLKISKDRTEINNQAVFSRIKLSTGEIEIKTKFAGKDNNKKALIKHTYLIGQNSYSDKKEIQFQNSDEWILRSEFSYVRKNSGPNS